MASGKPYHPATYEQDGFTHGTAEKARLLEVANHFYRSVGGDWVCLVMTEESLKATGVEVKYERAAAVGDTKAEFNGSDAVLFPHIFGGIHPSAVVDTLPVLRAPSGEFLAIGEKET